MLYKRVCNVAVFFTSIVVFFIWLWLYNTTNDDFPNIFHSETIQYIVKFLIFITSTFGFFKISVSIMMSLIEKVQGIKKILLGSSYFEGKWVGYYMAPIENTPVVFFQIIEQTIEYISIRTKAYNAKDMSHRGLWNSINDIYISPKKLEFSYQYEFISELDKSGPTYGTSTITNLYKKESIFKEPWKMDCYAFNLLSKERFRVELIKESDSITMDDNDEKKLLQKALEFYNNNKDNGNKNTDILDSTSRSTT